MTSEEVMRKAVDDGGTSDLKFIMADCEVSLRAQYELVSNGVTSERKLMNLEESKDKVREVLKTQFGMDGDASLPMRVQVSTILDAWESAKDFVKKENELRAEARSSHEPKEIQGPEQTMLRRAIQAIGGRRPDKEIPAERYLAKKMQETEVNAPQASPLEEMVSLDDDVDEGQEVSKDRAGYMKLTQIKKSLPPPASNEELRQRLRVDCNTWLMIKAKHTNRMWLQDLEKEVYETYIDYLLGGQVSSLTTTAPGEEGLAERQLLPPWTLVISYEGQIRKKAMSLVREEGETLAAGLKRAYKDQELRQRYFITPMALSPKASEGGGKRHGQHFYEDYAPWTKRHQGHWGGGNRGAGKGKSSKGRGKGHKGKQDKQGGGPPNAISLVSRTPDQKLICFAYNDPSQTCDGKCSMVHVCRVRGCHAKHPMYQCPRLAKP